MERCPNCRARVGDETQCPRCGMDLELILSVEQAAEDLVRCAVQRLESGDWEGARTTLRRSLGLRHDIGVQRLLIFVETAERGPHFGNLPA